MEKRCGTYCAYAGCKNTRSNSDVHFFSFPRDLKRSVLWVEYSGREDLRFKSAYQLAKSQHLCSDHFGSEMFVNYFDKKRLLPLAVPKRVPKDILIAFILRKEAQSRISDNCKTIDEFLSQANKNDQTKRMLDDCDVPAAKKQKHLQYNCPDSSISVPRRDIKNDENVYVPLENIKEEQNLSDHQEGIKDAEIQYDPLGTIKEEKNIYDYPEYIEEEENLYQSSPPVGHEIELGSIKKEESLFYQPGQIKEDENLYDQPGKIKEEESLCVHPVPPFLQGKEIVPTGGIKEENVDQPGKIKGKEKSTSCELK